MSASIYFLNGVSIEIASEAPSDLCDEIMALPQIVELTALAKSDKLVMAAVANRDESSVAVMLGVSIAPSFRSIFQGRTFVGDPTTHPLPASFPELRDKLIGILQSKYELAYTDVGIILSQSD